MKFVFAVLLIALCAFEAFSYPLEELEGEVQAQPLSRVKRVTCDVLSVEAKGVKLNHAACGIHCLFRGRTGGYCNGQRVCICR